jgi:FkbM family methyltransferase
MSEEITITASGRQLTFIGTWPEYLHGLQGWNADVGPVAQATKDLSPGALCLDVGANIGVVSIALAAQRPDCRIIAFEPIPDNANCLRHNIKINAILNVEVVEAAASDRRGYLPMANNGPYSAVTPRSSLQCRAVPLDDYSEHPVAFVKIDTEGYEPVVVNGARHLFLKHKPLVLAEFNSWCMLVHGYNPIEFSKAIWSSTEVLGMYYLDNPSALPKSSVDIAHENIKNHQCVTDVLFRPHSEFPEFEVMVYPPELIALCKELRATRSSLSQRTALC